VVSHAARCSPTERTQAVHGPDQAGRVLAAAEATGLIDFARPTAVLLAGVLHHVPDQDDPAGCVAEFRDAIAPGSCLVISHASSPRARKRDRADVPVGQEIAAAHQGARRARNPYREEMRLSSTA